MSAFRELTSNPLWWVIPAILVASFLMNNKPEMFEHKNQEKPKEQSKSQTSTQTEQKQKNVSQASVPASTESTTNINDAINKL